MTITRRVDKWNRNIVEDEYGQFIQLSTESVAFYCETVKRISGLLYMVDLEIATLRQEESRCDERVSRAVYNALKKSGQRYLADGRDRDALAPKSNRRLEYISKRIKQLETRFDVLVNIRFAYQLEFQAEEAMLAAFSTCKGER